MSRTRNTLFVLGTTALVLVACGQIAGLEDPPPAGTGPGAGADASAPTQADIEPQGADGIVFGAVDCAKETAGKFITITNKGTAPADYKVELPEGTSFRLDGTLTGTLQPGQTATVKTYVTTTVAGAVNADVLVTVGDIVKDIPLTASGAGAAIKLDPVLVAFGDVRYSAGATADVKVTNVGTKDLVIAGWAAQSNGTATTDFAVDNGGALTLPAAQTGTITVRLTSSNVESAALTAQIAPQVTGTLCGGATAITATGRRVSSDITVSSGDFGKQPCTTTPTKPIEIKNYTANALTYAATLAAGAASPFVIQGKATNTIASGSVTTPTVGGFTVAAAAPLATPGTVTDTLNVDMGSAGIKTIPLAIDVRGAIINVQPATITNFTRTYDWWGRQVTNYKQVQVSNTGNETVGINWNFKRTNGDPAWLWSYFPGSLDPGKATTSYVGFNPQGNCPCESTGTPAATTTYPICNALGLDFKGN